MKSAAFTSASYSSCSSSLSKPSFARAARASTRSCTGPATRNATTRRADSLSRHRLSGSINSSSNIAELISLSLFQSKNPARHQRPLRRRISKPQIGFELPITLYDRPVNRLLLAIFDPSLAQTCSEAPHSSEIFPSAPFRAKLHSNYPAETKRILA